MNNSAYAESSLELNRHIVNLLDSLSAIHGLTEIPLGDVGEQSLPKHALEALMSNQDMERCSIFLLDEDGMLSNAAGLDWDDMLKDIISPGEETASRGLSKNRFRMGEGIMGRAAESGEIGHCPSCADDPQFKQSGSEPVQGALLCVPITCEGKALGVLNVFYPVPGFFNLWHERLLLLFCKILGRMLVNCRLMHHLGELVERRTEALREINETLEARVSEQVAKNLENERLLIHQARLAAMGEMIGNIAHQWRQPLNALGLVLADIKDAYAYDELTPEYLDEAATRGRLLIERMSDTIDDFRNFFVPNREKVAFSLRQSVQHALAIVETAFHNSHIEIALEDGEDLMAFGFPNEYAQVVLNILGNAREAILAHKTTGGQINIRIERDKDAARLTVSDNGGGIPADILPKIFDPYFSTRESGAGIGLYMSKMIIEANMNGRIDVRNIDGGAEFRIIAPLFEKGAASKTEGV